ncbi:hypothetical protein A2973_04835 [Candidatus Gottesmanbacteria bacterium RIFCSPLOWO2_01_FULL_49_10]|uniref:Uncharacterized protein n=1 Tax=Candidatus Gottesmanbacteria bacterium RIFCSPLOWO2_01_FULL_49_10 TaxID=1798396 RepID=A0A1F6AYF0_9BACT|nr:MAG: hypothetical protein A2973_04835 [Candidatus Gottesmanbacteria bacterium RIFCSPLOWO2_01_FULL_49_10]
MAKGLVKETDINLPPILTVVAKGKTDAEAQSILHNALEQAAVPFANIVGQSVTIVERDPDSPRGLKPLGKAFPIETKSKSPPGTLGQTQSIAPGARVSDAEWDKIFGHTDFRGEKKKKKRPSDD